MIHAQAEFQELANLHNANGGYIQTTKKARNRSVKETLKAQSIFFFIFVHHDIPLGGFTSKLAWRVLKTA